MAANPAATCRCGAGRGPAARSGGYWILRYWRSQQADGTAKPTRPAATITASRAPNPAAISAARAGPAKLAVLLVIASSAEPRDSSLPVTVRGSCAVQPPATAGLNSPAA